MRVPQTRSRNQALTDLFRIVRFAALTAVFVAITPSTPARTLSGDEATATLRQRGIYDKILHALNEERYRVERTPADETGDYHAPNPAQALRTVFTTKGASIRPFGRNPVGWETRLQCSGWGYGDTLQPLPQAELVAAKNRIEYRRGSLTEWYVNEPRGVEQGFELRHAPDRMQGACSSDKLVIAMAITGDLCAEKSEDGNSILFKDASGRRVLRYQELKVWDATHRELPAQLVLRDSMVRIEIEDTGAQYPITVDPLIVSELTKLTASDGTGGEQFGVSICVSGDTAVVGAIFANSAEGAAYVFERNFGGADNWGEVRILTASDGASFDSFGTSVSISGDTIVVGANSHDSFKGAAYVYGRNVGGADNWGNIKKLTASDAASTDFFGTSVSISGDTIVVGAFGASPAGAAYVFERNFDPANPGTPLADNWGEVQKLTPSDGNDRFGSSVSISVDTIVVGAPFGNGTAYVFERNEGGAENWGEVQLLTPSDSATDDGFGAAVSISGDTLVVGAKFLDSSTGAAYVFARNEGGAENWGEVKKLTASDGATGDQFGISLSLSVDTLVVGASVKDEDKGAAYVFERNFDPANPGTPLAENWGEVQKLSASDGADSDVFGASVSISGDTIFVGAPGEDAAYVFVPQCGTWVQGINPTASDATEGNQFGVSVCISGDTAVVGAPIANSVKGAAYVFERNVGGADNWGEVRILTASDGAAFDGFGTSVSISGDTIVVGAHSHDSAKGAAYVYGRNTGGDDNWGLIKKLTASDAAATDFFGTSISISGDTIVVSAFGADPSGAAYVFERNFDPANPGTPLADNWGEVQILTPSDGNAFFGTSVSISVDTIVVGANFGNGTAYVFGRNEGGAENWGEVQLLTASDGAADDGFGSTVSISGDTLVVGAKFKDSSTGAVYVFARNEGGAENWGEVQKLSASDGATGDQFGISLSLSVDTVVIGASVKDSNTGAAYVFERNFDPANPGTPLAENWGEVQKLSASDGADSDVFGASVSISGDTIVVGASGKDAAYTFTLACLLSPCEITCPSNITSNNAPGQCGATVTYPDPTTTGSCSSVSCNPPSGSFFTVGTTNVVCAESNHSSKVASTVPGTNCTFTVTVNDTERPVLTCPADITTNRNSVSSNNIDSGVNHGGCNVVVNYQTPEANDNCDGKIPAQCSPSSGSAFASGTTTVNCTATDDAGNTTNCSFKVTVICGQSKPLVKIEVIDATASEPGSNTGRFRITRTGPLGTKLKVFYGVGGTATPGSDYQTLQGFVTIPAGDNSRSFQVIPKNDTKKESTETVRVTLSPNSSYSIGSPNNATVNILDNDCASLLRSP